MAETAPSYVVMVSQDDIEHLATALKSRLGSFAHEELDGILHVKVDIDEAVGGHFDSSGIKSDL